MLRRSLMINPADSVVCVLEDANRGDTVRTPSGEEITLADGTLNLPAWGTAVLVPAK